MNQQFTRIRIRKESESGEKNKKLESAQGVERAGNY